MVIDLKVLVKSFNCKTVHVMLGTLAIFFFFELPNMGPAKDKRGVHESFAKVTFLFAKNGRFRIKEF
jgi:hypothetical protein